jgi:hypothetical protein
LTGLLVFAGKVNVESVLAFCFDMLVLNKDFFYTFGKACDCVILHSITSGHESVLRTTWFNFT